MSTNRVNEVVQDCYATPPPPQAPVERKFHDLLNAASGLTEIQSHLTGLMRSIGINHPSEPCKGDEKVSEEPTLISTLTSLPNRIRGDVEFINKMIEEIKSALN